MIGCICIRFIRIVTCFISINRWTDIGSKKRIYVYVNVDHDVIPSKKVFLFSEAPRPALSLHPASYPVAAWIPGVKLFCTFNSHTVCLNALRQLKHWHMPTRTEGDHENHMIVLAGLQVSRAISYI